MRGWQVTDDRVVFADNLEISVQRTRPAIGWRVEPLPSYGAAPLVADDFGVMASVGDDEAFWIAFQSIAPGSRSAVRICIEAPTSLDAVTGGPCKTGLARHPQNYVVVPPQFAMDGMALGTREARLFVARATDPSEITCSRLRCTAYVQHGRYPPAPVPKRVHPLRDPSRSAPDDPGELIRKRIAPDESEAQWQAVAPISVSITFVDPIEFSARGGRPAAGPLDSAARYSGRRFP
jgi:hypothetical protein